MNIFISGRVYTQNGMMQAFVVDNGRFIYVGDNDGAMAYDGEVTDLKGRFVCAGFNDSHMHLLNFGYSLFVRGLIRMYGQYRPFDRRFSSMGCRAVFDAGPMAVRPWLQSGLFSG